MTKMLSEEKLNRINELAKKKKEGKLTPTEEKEQQLLRQEYLEAFRGGMRNHIEGLDYQILVEADFLVNLYEDNCSQHAINATCKNIFKTQAGISLLRDMYDKDSYQKPE